MSKKKGAACAVPMCSAKEMEIVYYGKNVCMKHWELHAAGELCLKDELVVFA